MKTCKICGLELQDEDKSCSKCGGKQFIKESKNNEVVNEPTESVVVNTEDAPVIIEKKQKQEYKPPEVHSHRDIIKLYLTYLIPVYGWAKLLEVVIRVEDKSKEGMFIRVNFAILLLIALLISIFINCFSNIVIRI